MRPCWVGLITALLLAGCGSEIGGLAPARLEVVHLAPDATPVALRRNGQPIPGIGPDGELRVSFHAASRGLEVNPDRARYTLRGTDDRDYADLFLDPVSHEQLSLRLLGLLQPTGELPGLSLVVVRTDNRLASNVAGVRLMHAVPGLGPVKLVLVPVDDEPAVTALATDLAYGQTTRVTNTVSALIEVPVAAARLSVRLADDTELAGVDVEPVAGQILELALDGRAATPRLLVWAGEPTE